MFQEVFEPAASKLFRSYTYDQGVRSPSATISLSGTLRANPGMNTLDPVAIHRSTVDTTRSRASIGSPRPALVTFGTPYSRALTNRVSKGTERLSPKTMMLKGTLPSLNRPPGSETTARTHPDSIRAARTPGSQPRDSCSTALLAARTAMPPGARWANACCTHARFALFRGGTPNAQRVSLGSGAWSVHSP